MRKMSACAATASTEKNLKGCGLSKERSLLPDLSNLSALRENVCDAYDSGEEYEEDE
jgi:hypothetical protein